MSADEPVLSIRGLEKHYPITQGVMKSQVGAVRAVDGISFDVREGETVGLVGESGCGKSTAAENLLRLEEPTGGTVYYRGEDVTAYDQQQLKAFRRKAQMVFQDPTSTFDPRMSVGESVAEPLLIHGMSKRSRRRAIVEDLLDRVGMDATDYDRYPHEFSGGQKQRIALARALVLNPDLLVADEPVSALDVSVQANILKLIGELQEAFGLSILLISHDMGVVREICDRVVVMYLGEIVEMGPTEELFEDPEHPYTQALMSSIPTADPRRRGEAIELTGSVPSPAAPPSGCRFHTRCPKVIQPEGLDLDQDDFRAVMNFRDSVSREDIDLETAREFVATERDLEGPEAVSTEQLVQYLRRDEDLRDSLADPDAEATLAAAFELVADGEFAAADERLAETFRSVCETDTPRLRADWLGVSDLRRALAAAADADGATAAENGADPDVVTPGDGKGSDRLFDADAVRAAAADRTGTDPSRVDRDTLHEVVRDRYDIPPSVGEEAAADVLDRAIDAGLDGRPGEGARLLREQFSLRGVGIDPDTPDLNRAAACHLVETTAPSLEQPATDD